MNLQVGLYNKKRNPLKDVKSGFVTLRLVPLIHDTMAMDMVATEPAAARVITTILLMAIVRTSIASEMIGRDELTGMDTGRYSSCLL